jgi:hypothetical protein
MLSCAGREVFLKTVIQALATHSMSCFRLTKKVCKTLMSIVGKYWWSSSLDRHSLHWVSCERRHGVQGTRALQHSNVG